MKRSLAAATVVGSMLVGGGVGVAVFAPRLAGADTTPTTTPTTSPSQRNANNATNGSFQGNEDPTHEAGESPEREAAEKNGTATYGHDGHRGPGAHGSNEDPQHEASESPEREAQENANQAAASTTTTTK